MGLDGVVAAGCGAVVGAGLGVSPVLFPPPGFCPPEGPGALVGDGTGAGGVVSAGADWPWTGSLEWPGTPPDGAPEAELSPFARSAGAGRAETRATGLWPSGSFLAFPIDSPIEGSSGRGAGEIRLKPGWAKIATRARPAAAVNPSRAKLVLRIRSVSPLPAKLGRRRAEISLRWRESTSSFIGIAPPPPSDWIGFLKYRFGYPSTWNERASTSITTSPSWSVLSVGTPCPARVARVPRVGWP